MAGSTAAAGSPQARGHGGPPKVIEWAHVDKRKYFVYGPALNFVTNALLYPTKLIKVRMQAETGPGSYRSVLHAARTIARTEGPLSLYRGFGVNCLGVLSSQIYITAYEVTRALARPALETELACNLAAGAAASVVQQGVAVPIDVVSQRLMIDRRGGGAATTRTVVKDIVRREGAAGFWKGTAASLLTFAPTSSIFWGAYGWLRRVQIALHPHDAPPPSYWATLGEQAAASWLAGCVAAACTNPLDIVKTRIQVSRRSDKPVTMRSAFRDLVREDGAMLLVKGLSARMIHMSLNSVILMTVYETVKRHSLLDEHRHVEIDLELEVEPSVGS